MEKLNEFDIRRLRYGRTFRVQNRPLVGPIFPAIYHRTVNTDASKSLPRPVRDRFFIRPRILFLALKRKELRPYRPELPYLYLYCRSNAIRTRRTAHKLYRRGINARCNLIAATNCVGGREEASFAKLRVSMALRHSLRFFSNVDI